MLMERETTFCLLRRVVRIGIPALLAIWLGGRANGFAVEYREGVYHVRPGESIQEALQEASRNALHKKVVVHAGTYRPEREGQALIWFNRYHDGITLEAAGEVTLTAANPEIADPEAASFPAVVNHVVYFGDGISEDTVFKGFRITGANHFVTKRSTRRMEPDDSIPKNLYFFSDGGGIKIFGRSYPTIIGAEVFGNFTSPCGAGVSVQHEGHGYRAAVFRDCWFRDNRTRVTGAAVDVLRGSSVELVNCLFTGNISNTGSDVVAEVSGEKPFTNCGVLTVFSTSRAVVRHCTFVDNRNAVDDMGSRSRYESSIFWRNTRDGGLPGTERFELNLQAGAEHMSRCMIGGKLLDPTDSVDPRLNSLDPPDPRFDAQFLPQSEAYTGIGYRPVGFGSGDEGDPGRGEASANSVP